MSKSDDSALIAQSLMLHFSRLFGKEEGKIQQEEMTMMKMIRRNLVILIFLEIEMKAKVNLSLKA